MTETGGDHEPATCRICQCDAEEECLRTPCQCKGSMAHVHASCLDRWRTLEPNARDKCTYCHTPYAYSRYDCAIYARPIGIVLFLAWLYAIDALSIVSLGARASPSSATSYQLWALSLIYSTMIASMLIGGKELLGRIKIERPILINLFTIALALTGFRQWSPVTTASITAMTLAYDLISLGVERLLGPPRIIT